MKKITKILFTFLSFFISISNIKAASLTDYFIGNNSLYLGDNINIVLATTEANSSGGVLSYTGTLNYDSSKLTLIKAESLAPFKIDYNANIIAGFGMNAIVGNQNIMRFTFKGLTTGNTTVTFSGGKQSDSLGNAIYSSGCSKQINILPPPSSNNFLKTLNLSNIDIAFNKSNLVYDLVVNDNISSTIINASSEDSKAKVYGVGYKNLNYGLNTFYITVEAENQLKKIYTIKITRLKEEVKHVSNETSSKKSNNNNLKSLLVEDNTLNPVFRKDITTYNIDTTASNINIKAIAEDSKAKISIIKNDILQVGENIIKLIVVAEDNSKKTYTIKVNRQLDNNTILSNNNNLASLKILDVKLLPEFNKEKLNYKAYVKNNITKITFAITKEDPKAIIKRSGPTKLKVGTNKYNITVIAEDNTKKIYTIDIIREKDNKNTTNINYIIIGIIIIILGLGIIYIIIRRKNLKKK